MGGGGGAGAPRDADAKGGELVPKIEVSLRDQNTCLEALVLILECLDSVTHTLAHPRDAACVLQERLQGLILVDAADASPVKSLFTDLNPKP
jgi:hypothetical protein